MPDDSRIVVAVSGGPDSICLFHLMAGLSYQISLAHFNHQLRPESDAELGFVQTTANSMKIPFYSQSMNIREFATREKMGIEEAARKARYEFLFRVAAETKSRAVITAHHADDQVETVLMNFIRGAGLKGLSGMPYCQHTSFSDRIMLARPLLDFRKEELVAFCQKNELQYFIDESNKDPMYLRNRIRTQLIPLLSEYNPNFIATVLRNQKALRMDLQYIQESTDSTLEKLGAVQKEGVITFSLEKYSLIPDALKNYVIKELIQRSVPEWMDVSYDLIQNTRDALENRNRSQQLFLENGIYLLVEGGEGILTSDPRMVWKDNWPTIQSEKIIPITEKKIDLDENWVMAVSVSSRVKIGKAFFKNPDPMTAYLDRSKTGDSFKVRFWQPGDVYQPLGMGGKSIKLSDFWINHKIPRRAKEKWPVLEAQGKIIWIPGFQPSHDARITDHTDEILILRLRKGS